VSALDLCTNEPAMSALLQRTLPGFAEGRLQIKGLRVCKARRSSSVARNPNPIALCYELSVREGSSDGRQLLYAKMFRGGASADCYRSIEASRLERPAFGAPLAHLPELDMVLWALPNDPGLPQLAGLLDPARIALPWDALNLDRARCRGVATELLRYEPEQRATLRCTVTLDGAAEPLVLYAKTFCDTRGRAIDERFEHFWQRAQADADAPLVAQPLGYDAATQTVWQASAAGTPLRELLAGEHAARLLAQVAQALAAVHAAPLGSARERPIAHWLAEARRRQTKIGRADPALAERARGLVDSLHAQAAQLAGAPLSLIHGDFHPDQLWLHRGRVVLFDFDEFTLGDPMEDVAAFALKLDDEIQMQNFIDGYAQAAPLRFDGRRLQWHLALQSLLQASRAFVYQRPGWRLELERWLARSEALARQTSP